jgi:erythromycin esterase
MRRLLAVSLVLALLVPTAEASRRRSVSRGRAQVVDNSPPAQWLRANAHVLQTVELINDHSDLEPLRSMIGSATVVGLGDDTHGTHEFYAVKLRILEFLVREMGFDALAVEGPFTVFEKLNVYIQGGAGDPRVLLRETRALGYEFWDFEEMLAVVEWMRGYNAQRGNRPVIEIAGADTFDPKGSADAVVAYLRTVDPAAANSTQTQYTCVYANERNDNCRGKALNILSALESRRAELGAITGFRAFDDAVQNARTITQYTLLGQSNRDAALAANTLWIRDHRGSSRRIAVWMHQEHVGRNASPWIGQRPAGRILAETLGSSYFVIGTLAGSGTYRDPAGVVIPPIYPAAPDGTYERMFAAAGASFLLVPLRGSLPEWLSQPASYRTAGISSGPNLLEARLADKLDAVVYVETMTPTRVLP